MFRVILRAERIPEVIGRRAALDIADGFKKRSWQENALCIYESVGLTFISENDFDQNGLATQDEFAHEYSANAPIFEGDDGNLRIVRIETI